MSVLTEGEIKRIVHRASLLQNLNNSTNTSEDDFSDSLEGLFEITDSLGINREFVQEAFVEYQGVSVQDPIPVDNIDSNVVEVVGFTNNGLDNATINEFRSILEYHFNNEGKSVQRKNRIIWRAKPKGIAKYFSMAQSPEAEIDYSESQLKVSVRQNLKTLNKLYWPPAFFSFIFVIVAMAEDPEFIIPAFVMAGIAFVIGQLVSRKRKNTKRKLVELMESLQQVFERRFLSKQKQATITEAERIHMPENEYEEGNSTSSSIEVKE